MNSENNNFLETTVIHKNALTNQIVKLIGKSLRNSIKSIDIESRIVKDEIRFRAI